MQYFTLQSFGEYLRGGVASNLQARDHKSVTDIILDYKCVGNGQMDQIQLHEVVNTLDCMHDQKIVVGSDAKLEQDRKYVLRRLTPTECARLQGFPDWWCDGANGSDSAMYKMWGNGIALPCAVDVLGRIAMEMRIDADEA